MEYTKRISKSESYYKIDASGRKEDNGGGGKQVSYNLPQKFVDAMLNSHAIVPSNSTLHGRPVWVLAENYTFVLGSGILDLIGNRYRDIAPKFIVSEGIGNTKWQLFRRIYDEAGGLNHKWFVDLYDSAVQGTEIIYDLNIIRKTITMDID